MNLIKRIKEYIKDVVAEMKKVSWAKPRELWTTTLVVIVFSAVLAAFIGLCDFVFSHLLALILR
ncbi:MAG: preprotein translocase subunit SecE [candidate division WOR-3 bacterium]|jgi:preprotein translocase subunit SecE|nr:preprotein translocase subunit SecE [candidate division WOR-3 bacterium]MCR4423792.1 preprotein translocase subunit SecE [candidate division WOR-3 bacterium]MDH7519131.1 preprotein translocase subunit SecE [bacterium]